MADLPLRGSEHPYYCAEGSGDNHCTSWQEFLEDGAPSVKDPDLNLLFRWDWTLPDPEDSESVEELKLFFVLQRKGMIISYTVEVSSEDEPLVREWLTERLQTLKKVWTPLF